MNERIRELATQAGIAWKDSGALTQGHTTDDLEKFAELIVLECAKVAYKAELNDLEIRLVSEVIQEHFGVKNEFN